MNFLKFYDLMTLYEEQKMIKEKMDPTLAKTLIFLDWSETLTEFFKGVFEKSYLVLLKVHR